MISHSFRPRRRTLLVLGLTTALAAAPLAATAGPTGRVDGIWRTDGYSSTIVVEGGKAQFYATTSTTCAPAELMKQTGSPRPDGTVRFAGAGQPFTFRAVRDRAVLQLEGSVGSRHLIRVEKLPNACTEPAPTGPMATFDQFWSTYAENYPFFRAKGIDWTAVRDRYRPRVRPGMSDAELFDLLVEMVEPLGDAHTGIRSPDREFAGSRPGTTLPDPALEARIRPYIEQTALRGRTFTSYANNRIGYADLPGRIGYLRVIAFMGYAGDEPDYRIDSRVLKQTLDVILTKERVSGPNRLRGLIIDLRLNGGGSDQLGLELAGRLTERPYFAYFKRARNDATDATRFTAPQPLAVRPAAATAYTGPIALLTGGSQMSAGETFTQALMNRRPQPVRIGANTQGVFSDVLLRTLPNGWQYILPNEEFRTLGWKSFDGAGIPPHVRRPVFTAAELAGGRDSAFATAVALLARSR